MNSNQQGANQPSSPQSLALSIVQALAPNGYGHYCYDTDAKNDAAKMRDWLHAASKIEPLIAASHQASQAKIAALVGALESAQHVLRPLIPHSSPVLASISAALELAPKESLEGGGES